ncbi:MAG: amidohydrolase family protein [Alphaproteobacteria bacterium]|nr:amidohydrolase family protein [Alphaproteobacteria bacterium]
MKIDADAHVIETPHTWDYLDESEQDFRPQIFVRDPHDGAPYGANQRNEYWKIGDHFQTKTNVSRDLPEDVRDMEDIAGRLGHMDETDVDVQVLYPTLFLRPVTHEHDREMALVRSYNRWLADIWKTSAGRLRWVALPPICSLVDAGRVRDELEYCKANGACGIFMRGFETERFTNDRYFFPLFEIAQDLGLAICYHAGNNSFVNHDSFNRDLGVMIFKFPVMGAFLYLLGDEIPKRFPGVRWAFVEASANWVPYMRNEAQVRLRAKGVPVNDALLTENNFYITTQKTDDLNWLLETIGDDNLIVGTDYGHNDASVEIEIIQRMCGDGSIPVSSAKKILETNPGTLYGIA